MKLDSARFAKNQALQPEEMSTLELSSAELETVYGVGIVLEATVSPMVATLFRVLDTVMAATLLMVAFQTMGMEMDSVNFLLVRFHLLPARTPTRTARITRGSGLSCSVP